TLVADSDGADYGMATNPYLDANAKCVHYEVTVTVDGATMTYDEDSVLAMSNLPDLLHHTDRNTLARTVAYQLEV
ncbi:MAG: hypothetical protein KDB10_06975, partial [Acidimicrobiales bacterium]|nr:hypothetical protein [Acidimicrobiales bacterium]